MAQTTAAAVANEFLELQAADPGFPPIDPMKLQKLVFYAHAWYLGFTGKPLFDEDVFAWPWGPVVPPVYHAFNEFGRHPIAGKRAQTLVQDNGALRFVIPQVTDPYLKTFIKGVWDSHKRLTGVQLSNATHLAGEPWTIIKDQYGSLDSKPLIPNDLIARVFAARAQQATAAHTGA
jgi:uncharacterized phage-associated protein